MSHAACATGTLNLIDAARRAGVRRVVYAASSSAYGGASSEDGQTEDTPIKTLSPYAAAKFAGELYLQAFTATYGLETVRLRFFNIFGPRQRADSPYSGVIALFIAAMSSGKPPLVHGDGLQSRDFTYVANAVQALMKAAESPKSVSGNVYNIGTHASISVLQLVDALNNLLGRNLKPIHAEPRAGDAALFQSRYLANLSRPRLRPRCVVRGRTQANLGLVSRIEVAAPRSTLREPIRGAWIVFISISWLSICSFQRSNRYEVEDAASARGGAPMSPITLSAETGRTAMPTQCAWSQQWDNLLFAHWQVGPEIIRHLVPNGLQLDLRDGSAWISIVAFDLTTRRFGISLRFPELNLRTYVRHRDEPGVLFLSLHAGHRLGVALARRLTPLPYFHAPIRCTRMENSFTFRSPRMDAECRLNSVCRPAAIGSLDEWLLERYRGFTLDRHGQLFTVAVSHPRWQIRDGSLQLHSRWFDDFPKFDFTRQPDTWHFSDGVAARIGKFEAFASR